MGSGRSCCGAPTDSGFLGLAGCFFFLFPLFALTGLGLAIAAVARSVSGRTPPARPFFRELNRVALGMINDAMTARARCGLSGALFGPSPRLAGALFKYLNVALLGAAWILLICSGAAAV